MALGPQAVGLAGLHSLHTSEASAMYLTAWETQTTTKAWLELFWG